MLDNTKNNEFERKVRTLLNTLVVTLQNLIEKKMKKVVNEKNMILRSRAIPRPQPPISQISEQ